MPKPGGRDVLIVVDVQVDFLPSGALAVNGSGDIVPAVNDLASRFGTVVLTQDWHPAGHSSFASSHPGASPFGTTQLSYGQQVLWPDHCVQGSPGAAFAADLSIPHAQLIIRKGCNPAIDSYSAFQEADRRTMTGLAGYLRERETERLYVCGLATDYCVGWTALDGAAAGFRVTVVEDACRAIDLDGSLDRAWRAIGEAGIARIRSADLR